MISRIWFLCLFAALVPLSWLASAQETPVAASPAVEAAGLPLDLRARVEEAVQQVKQSLVRIHVVETYYSEGREMKYEASGSGVVITPQGHVITNHHVAGHAKQLKCVFSDKREVEADLVAGDPLTDIAIIKLHNPEAIEFPVVEFGDSSQVQVGDLVLAMGSPLALSQSVTLGIVSNTEMIMPEFIRRFGGMTQDGEDVGSLVRWIGHDAAIFPGNSGGPLVSLDGKIVGINELGMGLGGAIPGNLAKEVADEIIEKGKVPRAWLGIDVQPRLKHDEEKRGVLVGGTIKGSPAEQAGVTSGDRILSVSGTPVDVQFGEQLPDFNNLVANLPIGEEITLVVDRKGEEVTLKAKTVEREAFEQKQYELKQWGLTVRNLSTMMAKEMKRDNNEGVMVTSVRTGGPAGDAKPVINEKDVIVEIGGKPVKNVEELEKLTEELTKDATEPVPALTTFERKTDRFVTVVKVGIKELEDPGREVKKAWLPVETQVITRDIADLMKDPNLKGFRVTQVYKGSTAEQAGLQVGDLILSVDDQPLTADALEHYEELNTLVRQYRPDDTATLTVRRGTEELKVPVKLIRAPMLAREMKKFEDKNFEFTVRDITFFDKATEQWKEEQRGVLVDEVKPGGWAALGQLSTGDLILSINGENVETVEAVETIMKRMAEGKPKVVVLKTLRGIHTYYVELEPKWETA
ncbi:MAG: PDZ domain-containing protein [Candidatus Hydrogenedentes bacterium]|nr:PDZ domain-containing protein [Candidatus Hydrogenedentota bacterium]